MRTLDNSPLPAREPTHMHVIYCLNIWFGRLAFVFYLTTNQASFKTQMTLNVLIVCRPQTKPSKAGILLSHGINYLHKELSLVYISKSCLVCGGVSAPNSKLRGNTFVWHYFPLCCLKLLRGQQCNIVSGSRHSAPARPPQGPERKSGRITEPTTSNSRLPSMHQVLPQTVGAFFKEALSSSISKSSRVLNPTYTRQWDLSHVAVITAIVFSGFTCFTRTTSLNILKVSADAVSSSFDGSGTRGSKR